MAGEPHLFQMVHVPIFGMVKLRQSSSGQTSATTHAGAPARSRPLQFLRSKEKITCKQKGGGLVKNNTLDTTKLVAWIAATHGIEIAEATASLMLSELEPALSQALAALEKDDIEGEPADFRAILTARAEQQP
jgi:hypothetical protein